MAVPLPPRGSVVILHFLHPDTNLVGWRETQEPLGPRSSLCTVARVSLSLDTVSAQGAEDLGQHAPE